MLPWLLVIVDDLDIVYSVFLPAETDPPLVVNTYAVPAQSVAFQRFDNGMRYTQTVIKRRGLERTVRVLVC